MTRKIVKRSTFLDEKSRNDYKTVFFLIPIK
jgi:hypothetical protein